MPSFFNPITKMDFNNFFRKMDEYGAEVPDRYFKTKKSTANHMFGFNILPKTIITKYLQHFGYKIHNLIARIKGAKWLQILIYRNKQS